MDKSFEKKYHCFEKDFWWAKGRRQIILQLIENLNIKKDSLILDIGCTNGSTMKFLEKRGYKIEGLDISQEAINICIQKDLKVYRADATNTKLKEESFDLIIASDILEHLNYDFLALNEWARILKDGGKLIIFVPAFKFLWSGHDELHHHFRRYTKRELINLLKKSGFVIKRFSYWNFFLFLPITIIRLLKKTFFHSKVTKKNWERDVFFSQNNSFLNYFLFTILKIEKIFLRTINFPIGISFFIIAEK